MTHGRETGEWHMRVLFTSTHGYGHAMPMLPLAVACRDAGHQVLWVTNGAAVGLVRDAGIQVRVAGLDGDALHQALQDLRARASRLPPSERAAYMYPEMFASTFAPAMLEGLLPVAEDFAPDVMVHEHGELAAPLVAAVLQVPCLTHAFGGAIPASFVAEAGDRLAEHRRALALPPVSFAGCFDAGYLDICPTSVQTVSLDHVPVRQPLRPLPHRPPDRHPLPRVLLEDDPRPLVYVTFGTETVPASTVATTLTALGRLAVRVLATTGPRLDPTSLGPVPPNVVVERFVPQSEVLPRAAAVVSHSGSGTFLAALAAGLPQLCLPQAADQFRNAAGGQRAGAVLVLTPAEATVDTIEETARRVLTDDNLRAAAERVSEEIAAMPAPDEVVHVLEAVA
jgi:UDP:flavonoid glycosyltransferase YjiC (YdhE family)